MSRYSAPAAGAIIRTNEKVWENDAWAFGGGLASIAAFVAGLIAGFNADPGFFFLFALPVVYLLNMFVYFVTTTEIKSHGVKPYFNANYTYLPEIKGTPAEALAVPMIKQIWKCTLSGAHGERSYRYCDRCEERSNLIRRMAPEQIEDTKDIETAKRFLAMKDEQDRLHAEALKELTA